MLALIFAITTKKDPDGAATIFGKQLRIVRSDSMAENAETDVSDYEIGSLPVKSVLFIDVVPEDKAEADAWYAELKVGDVLTFRYVYGTQVTITHRIIAIAPNETGGYDISLTGDNFAGEYGGMTQKIDTSDEASLNYVIGKVTGHSYTLGVVIYALRTPVGITCIVIVPCLIVIAMEIVRIVGAFRSEKTEKVKEESAKQQNEIEELKRQLAMLQQSVAAPVGSVPAPPVATETATEAKPIEAVPAPAENEKIRAETAPTDETTTESPKENEPIPENDNNDNDQEIPTKTAPTDETTEDREKERLPSAKETERIEQTKDK
ncbi:MAG: hypothetical protein IJX91_02570 [Clostridia bacterium]|nr:hypothetical protein [Clostridia bacterium]